MKAQFPRHCRDLETICLRSGVALLEVFGSSTGEAFGTQHSEFDFLVEFVSRCPREHYENYFGLLEALGRLFARSIDLIEPQTIRNPIVRRRADESRTLLYAA